VQISTIAKQVSRITGARVRFAVNASPDSWSYQVDFTKIARMVQTSSPGVNVPLRH
jgi:hypothetical protein